MRFGAWLLIFLRKEQYRMKLVLAEKPSVAMSLSKCSTQISEGTVIWRAMAILSAGVWGIWWNFPSRKPMMKSMPSGGMMIFRFCRNIGSIRCLPARKSSLEGSPSNRWKRPGENAGVHQGLSVGYPGGGGTSAAGRRVLRHGSEWHTLY